MGLIFYSFEVLMSTIELQSISSNGPLVMEITNDIDFADANLCIQSASDGDSIHTITRDFDSSETPNVRYLHHHESDGADTLRFDSTDEYFKTVEHEPHRMLELRDNL